MGDWPILFSAPMVQALLAGRKTQTRRLFKPRGFEFYTHEVSGDRYNEYRPYRDGTWDGSRITGGGPMGAFGWGEGLYSYLPYAPGDQLWVKETWRAQKAHDDIKPSLIPPCSRVWHEADGRDNCDQHGKTRVSIFMPRWASRLTLTVTDVRVERLQDIVREDAIAEGVQRVGGGMLRWENWSGAEGQSSTSPQGAYALLWNSINGPGAWDANPWVVAVSFDVHRCNIDQMPTPTPSKESRCE